MVENWRILTEINSLLVEILMQNIDDYIGVRIVRIENIFSWAKDAKISCFWLDVKSKNS